MKRLFLACFLSVLCVAAKAAEAPVEFRQAFVGHQEKGTLFHYQTPRGFEVKAWGTFYRDAVAEQFQGDPLDGLRLEVGAAEGYKAQVGNKVALSFRLHNESDKDIPVTVSGSCKMVHQAGYMLIDPQGRLLQSLGREVVGGPHCFCRQTTETLRGQSSVELDTKTDSDVVVGFAPPTTGKYVVIGIYQVPTKENHERHVLSQPFVLEITEKDAN